MLVVSHWRMKNGVTPSLVVFTHFPDFRLTSRRTLLPSKAGEMAVRCRTSDVMSSFCTAESIYRWFTQSGLKSGLSIQLVVDFEITVI